MQGRSYSTTQLLHHFPNSCYHSGMRWLLGVLGLALLVYALIDVLWTCFLEGGAPVTTRACSWVAKGLLKCQMRRTSRRLIAKAGLASTVVTVLVWGVSIWAGWTLIFYASPRRAGGDGHRPAGGLRRAGLLRRVHDLHARPGGLQAGRPLLRDRHRAGRRERVHPVRAGAGVPRAGRLGGDRQAAARRHHLDAREGPRRHHRPRAGTGPTARPSTRTWSRWCRCSRGWARAT